MPEATQNATLRSAAPLPPTSTTGQPRLALPTPHLGAALGMHSNRGVGSDGQWQRCHVDGVVGGRVRGGHGHHQLQLLNDVLQAGPMKL